jgi:carbonic anhydrase
VLRIANTIVCGHYRCGGIQAAFGPPTTEPLEGWIAHVRAVREAHAGELDALPDNASRWQRLCELNVIAQVRIVADLAPVAGA